MLYLPYLEALEDSARSGTPLGTGLRDTIVIFAFVISSIALAGSTLSKQTFRIQ